MKKQKLSLAKETLRTLTPVTLSDVVGGGNLSAAVAVCRNHSAAAILCHSAAAAVTCLHSAAAAVCHVTVMNHAAK
jgi:hypothetical protein